MRERSGRRAPGACAWLPLLLAPWLAQAAPYAGRPVQEVLRELGNAGVNVIYTTELVPPGLIVAAEPRAGAPLEVARAVLAAHGLALVAVAPGSYAVTRAAAPAPEPAAPAGPPALPELVVTTSRYALADDPLDGRSFLTGTDVDALPKLADEPLRAVRHLPGAAASGISAQSHLRGGGLDEVLMVLDGLPLQEPFHLKNFLTPVSVFDAAAIESMEVSSGGFTANHGDRMSGVIDITPLTAPAPRYTELGLSLFHASALSAGEFADARGTWLGSVRRSNLDWLSRFADEDRGKPEYFDAFARLSFATSDTTSFFASLLTSRDEIVMNTVDKAEQVDAEYRNTYVWGGWQQDWGGGLASRLTLALTDVDNDREGRIDEPGERTAAVDERRTLRMGVARLDLEYRLPRLYTRFGAEGREVEARYRYQSALAWASGAPWPGHPGGSLARDLRPNPDGHQLAAWVSSRWRVTDRLSAEAGLRWDNQTYDAIDGPDQISPRFNLLHELTPTTRLRAGWGRFWQSQGINELQVEDGDERFHPAQRADHLIASLEPALPGGLDLRIEAYQKDYDRLRPHWENLFDPVTLLPEFEPDRVQVDASGGRARGVEVLLTRRAAGPWSWWLGYTWSRVTDHIGGEDVARSWDQRHAVNAGLRYAGERWELTLTDNYHTGWPTTALVLTQGTGGSPDTVAPGPRNAQRFDAYNSLDLRLLRRFALPDSTLETFFELTNALGQRNACCTEYAVYGTGDALVVDPDEDYWPRLIPSLGVTWKF
ncbi:MAG: TonB-dependent receptor [Gammaproteobacteria bacterium]|nr:TonB-dependent receptor [Gammaproteobacteria bacterium]